MNIMFVWSSILKIDEGNHSFINFSWLHCEFCRFIISTFSEEWRSKNSIKNRNKQQEVRNLESDKKRQLHIDRNTYFSMKMQYITLTRKITNTWLLKKIHLCPFTWDLLKHQSAFSRTHTAVTEYNNMKNTKKLCSIIQPRESHI